MNSLTALSFEIGTLPVREGSMTFSERLAITRELLIALTHATRAGQYHLMRRVLDILEDAILRPSLQLTDPQLLALMAAVTELQHEAARTAADITVFYRQATLVLDILLVGQRSPPSLPTRFRLPKS